MDVSDGLLIDTRRMAEASGCAIEITSIPLSSDYVALHGLSVASRLAAATAGDDYVLLAAAPHRTFVRLKVSWRSGIALKGRVSLSFWTVRRSPCRTGWAMNMARSKAHQAIIPNFALTSVYFSCRNDADPKRVSGLQQESIHVPRDRGNWGRSARLCAVSAAALRLQRRVNGERRFDHSRHRKRRARRRL